MMASILGSSSVLGFYLCLHPLSEASGDEVSVLYNLCTPT